MQKIIEALQFYADGKHYQEGRGWDSQPTVEDGDMARQALADLQAQQAPLVAKNPLSKRCYAMSEAHLNGYRLVLGFNTLEDLDAAHLYVAAPQAAPTDTSQCDMQTMQCVHDAALEQAAKVIELYDDATMKADYMLDATECAEIIRSLIGQPAKPAEDDRKDAERIYWLEQHDGQFYNIDSITAIVGVGFNGKASLRAAIDAAIAQGEQG